MTHQTDERMDPLKALREELASVAPPSEFAARVRQGIDAGAAVRGASWLSGWRWLVPVAAAAAIVTAVFVMSRPTTEAPQQVVAQAPVNKPAVPPASALARTSTAAKAPVYAEAPAYATASAGKSAGKSVDKREPEVITNQPEILRALWARVDAKAVLAESTPATLPDTVPAIVVNPIEVSPIVIKWLGDPQTAPGTPIIRRVTADMAERSEK